jgi:hypothetical protein
MDKELIDDCIYLIEGFKSGLVSCEDYYLDVAILTIEKLETLRVSLNLRCEPIGK